MGTWKKKMTENSARLTLRLHPKTHQRLKVIAGLRRESINDILLDVIDRFSKRELKRLQDQLKELGE